MKNMLLRSYGRKRARGLSVSQENSLLKLYGRFGIEHPIQCDNAYSIEYKTDIDISKIQCNPCDFFDYKVDKIVVEIGFGMGEHLIQNATLNYMNGFIGCEPFENGVANVLKAVDTHKINNVRVFNGDGRILINSFPTSSVDRFFVLFPDPWPKKRHQKRRLLSVDCISMLCNKLKLNGDIVFATDCRNYMDMVLGNIKHISQIKIMNPLLTRPEWFIKTRYEEKALAKGEKPYYAILMKIADMNVSS